MTFRLKKIGLKNISDKIENVDTHRIFNNYLGPILNYFQSQKRVFL